MRIRKESDKFCITFALVLLLLFVFSTWTWPAAADDVQVVYLFLTLLIPVYAGTIIMKFISIELNTHSLFRTHNLQSVEYSLFLYTIN